MPGTKIPEAERREQILRAAVLVAAREGLSSLTVRKVAEEADVSVGLIFFHYRTMDALREALLSWLLERVLTLDAAELAARPGTPRERFVQLIAEELAAVQTLRPEISLLADYWTESQHQPDVRQALQQAYQRYGAVVREAAAAALVGSSGALSEVEGLAVLAVRSILGLALETLLNDGPPAIEAHLARLAALVPGGAVEAAGICMEQDNLGV